jgi:UDP-galactopyranose mutase
MKCSVLVVGAGLSGLSAAYHLQEAGVGDYLIVERSDEAGGLARTESCDGFSFDRSIHILYSSNAYIADLICNRLLPGQVRTQARESYCYTVGRYHEYPYQTNNYGLPPEVIVQNVLGLISATNATPQSGPPAHFEEWIYRTFGAGIADNFMIPYNRRQWAWDLTDMGYDWIADRVPMPDLKDVLRGAVAPPEKKYGPNREFWYPSSGGINSLPRALVQRLPADRLRLKTGVVAIDPVQQQAHLTTGECIRYEYLISTVPVPALVRMLGGHAGRHLTTPCAGLKSNVVHTVNVGLEGPTLRNDRRMHWVYVPDNEVVFHRISFPHEFSSWMAPEGCCSVQAEVSESVHRPLDRSGLIERTLAGLVTLELLTEAEARPVSAGGRVRFAKIVTLDPAYIIYDLQHRVNMETIKEALASWNIETRGRFGEWEYFNMDHAMLSGKAAADRFVSQRCYT